MFFARKRYLMQDNSTPALPPWIRRDAIRATEWLLDDGLPLKIMQIAFDAASFDSAWFADAGLAFPAEIQRSVNKRQAEFFYGRLCSAAALERLGIAGVP